MFLSLADNKNVLGIYLPFKSSLIKINFVSYLDLKCGINIEFIVKRRILFYN